MKIERINTKKFKRVITTEQEFDIDELKDTLRIMKDASRADNAVEKRLEEIKLELAKTNLSEDEISQIMQPLIFSPSGYTKKMINDLEAEILALEAL